MWRLCLCLPLKGDQDSEDVEKELVVGKSSPFDSLASRYDAWFDGEGKLIFTIEVEALRKVLSSLPKPWLEVGVGSGRFAQVLGIGFGVDPSIRLLEMAKRRGISVFLGRGEQMFFKKGSFGTVFFIVTLCFVSSPLDVLKEAYQLLILGGRIVLGLVLKESEWGRYYEEKKRRGHPFYRYATFYTYDEVAELLKEAGFVVERVISTLFQKPGRVEQSEPSREGYYPDAGFTVIVAKRLEK